MLAPCRISTRFERTISPAWGINGGGEGQSGHVLIERTDGTTQVALKETLMLNAGDRVRIRTGGGGGYGDPKHRDRERVRTDVMRGYVSPEAAREVYGLDTTTYLSFHSQPGVSMPKLRISHLPRKIRLQRPSSTSRRSISPRSAGSKRATIRKNPTACSSATGP